MKITVKRKELAKKMGMERAIEIVQNLFFEDYLIMKYEEFTFFNFVTKLDVDDSIFQKEYDVEQLYSLTTGKGRTNIITRGELIDLIANSEFDIIEVVPADKVSIYFDLE